MKWYKKQLDQLKKLKPELVALNKEDKNQKNLKTQFSIKKLGVKNNFPNPVAASNKSRPKTDSK